MNEWKEVRFDEIGVVFSGGTPSTSNPELWDGNIAFVTPFDLSKNRIPYIKQTQRFITHKGLEQSSANLLPANNLILSSRAPIGYISLSATEFVTNQGCKSLLFFYNQEPLFHYYNLQMYVNEMKRYGVGTTFSEISKGDLSKLKIQIPKEKNEQKRIAHILTTCDTVIEQTQSAIAKYKAIKQGLLHDLFTRGLNANGKLRPSYQQAPELYKESELGMIPKEWEVKRLDKLVENFDGKRIPVKQGDRDNQAKIYPYYGASGIIDYVNDFIFDDELILLGEDGENVLSRNLPLAFSVRGKIWVNNHAHVLKPLNFMEIGYLNAALELIDYTPIVSGSAQPKITQKELNKLLVKKPNKQEQLGIALRISAIDNKIQTEETLLQKYQSIKRGLMGDLLGGRKEVKNLDYN